MTDKPKKNFLAGLKALNVFAPPDWDAKIAAAEHAVTIAAEEHGRAALDADRELPGAAQSLMHAVEALQAARAKLETVKAAQRAWEAEDTARRANVTAAEAARQDKASRAAFDALVIAARKIEAVIANYAEGCEAFVTATEACQTQFGVNPRLRPDLKLACQPNELISREITRMTKMAKLPPGANALAAALSNPHDWEPLSKVVEDLARSVLPAAGAKPKPA